MSVTAQPDFTCQFSFSVATFFDAVMVCEFSVGFWVSICCGSLAFGFGISLSKFEFQFMVGALPHSSSLSPF